MRKLAFVPLLVVALSGRSAVGQAVRPRSADYLFAATVSDVRALWLNPAGLAVVTNASIMAEFVVERSSADDLRLAQWSAGLNARVIAIGYQRDRFVGGSGTGALRIGAGLPFPRGAIGGALTFHLGSAVDSAGHRGMDLGAMYQLAGPLNVALAVRNIGRPVPRDTTLPLTAVVGAALNVLPRHLELAMEVLATERVDTTGYELGYRGGLRVSSGGRLPIGVVGAITFDRDLGVAGWAIGISVGGQDHLQALGSAAVNMPPSGLERVSLTAVSSRSFSAGSR